jgi:hypothetical protein
MQEQGVMFLQELLVEDCLVRIHFKENYNFSSKSLETAWVLSQEITMVHTKSVVLSYF